MPALEYLGLRSPDDSVNGATHPAVRPHEHDPLGGEQLFGPNGSGKTR